MAAPALMDELIEECLVRLPPDDPTNLVRAAVVCKGWRRIFTQYRGFGRRFRELHGRPLMLGFLHIDTTYVPLFMPTSSFIRLGGWHAVDLRHGRVLLSRSPSVYGISRKRRRIDLAVWDPVSGDQLDLPELAPQQQPPHWFSFTSKAAVLCASSNRACDHLDCHSGHFLVVLMDTTYHGVDIYVYSSQAGTWSHQTSAAQDRNPLLLPRPPVTMAGNALYFIVCKWTVRSNAILRYDTGAHDVSWVELPPDCSAQSCPILLSTTENGGLGIVRVEKNSRLLRLWSSEAGPNGVLGWAPSGVIELETVLPANFGSISTVAFVHGLGAFFITAENAGAFAVDLVSNRVRKMVCGNNSVNYFVPYTSLCTPALGAALTGEGSTAGMPT